MKLKTKYRIVRDNYEGFEVQSKQWWMPLWIQCDDGSGCNTHKTIEMARAFIELHKKGINPVVYQED